jgi:hypothetical protein
METDMPRLCNDCNTLMAFRLADEPCAACQAAQSVAPASIDDCSTLEAFGWVESTCAACRVPVAA